MELNLQKIKMEMKRMGILNKSELARQMNTSKQLIHYYFNTKTIKAAESFGKFFKISAKDLIK